MKQRNEVVSVALRKDEHEGFVPASFRYRRQTIQIAEVLETWHGSGAWREHERVGPD